VRTEKDSKLAFNVGADAMWMFGENLGVGGIVRYARTSVDIPMPENRTISVDAGGGAWAEESGSCSSNAVC
jgi:hypothetical protein